MEGTMFGSLLNEEKIEMFKNEQPFVVRNSEFPEISWQTILELLNQDILNENPIGKTIYKDYGFRLIEATRIPEVRLLVDELYSVFAKSPHFEESNEEDHAHQIYISLTTQEGSYGGKHHEPEHVIFWQLNGSSTWTIYKNETEVEIVQTLHPGDIIYCPPSRWHQVSANSPRCAVSMGFGSLATV
jgi:quercetin dioxygenase-like cupin family protein